MTFRPAKRLVLGLALASAMLTGVVYAQDDATENDNEVALTPNQQALENSLNALHIANNLPSIYDRPELANFHNAVFKSVLDVSNDLLDDLKYKPDQIVSDEEAFDLDEAIQGFCSRKLPTCVSLLDDKPLSENEIARLTNLVKGASPNYFGEIIGYQIITELVDPDKELQAEISTEKQVSLLVTLKFMNDALALQNLEFTVKNIFEKYDNNVQPANIAPDTNSYDDDIKALNMSDNEPSRLFFIADASPVTEDDEIKSLQNLAYSAQSTAADTARIAIKSIPQNTPVNDQIREITKIARLLCKQRQISVCTDLPKEGLLIDDLTYEAENDDDQTTEDEAASYVLRQTLLLTGNMITAIADENKTAYLIVRDHNEASRRFTFKMVKDASRLERFASSLKYAFSPDDDGDNVQFPPTSHDISSLPSLQPAVSPDISSPLSQQPAAAPDNSSAPAAQEPAASPDSSSPPSPQSAIGPYILRPHTLRLNA